MVAREVVDAQWMVARSFEVFTQNIYNPAAKSNAESKSFIFMQINGNKGTYRT